jgi:hypothetical protein
MKGIQQEPGKSQQITNGHWTMGAIHLRYVDIRFSIEQERFYRIQGMASKAHTGTTWAQRLIKFLMAEVHSLRKTRCAKAHEALLTRISVREYYEAVARTFLKHAGGLQGWFQL